MKRLAVFLSVALVLLAVPVACREPRVDSSEQSYILYYYPAPIPFDLVSNKPFLQVTVNGSGPFWFCFDTGSGGGCILSRRCAKALDLKIEGEKKTSAGAGEGAVVTIGHAQGITFSVGGEELANQNAMVVPLDHVSAYEGRHMEGTLGYNFISRFVVEIDYADKTMFLHDPATYKYSGPGKTIPIKFLNGLVIVRASVTPPGRKPIEADFVIDTGARTALIFNSPFVKEHRLLESLPQKFLATIGGGVGGESKGYVGRLESLQLGPFRLSKPVAVFSTDKSGVLAGKAFAGIIGGRVLRRCRVIFDYQGKRMILEPYAGTPKPYEYDMSGLFLVAEGPHFKKFKVQSVVKESPAEEAGIQKGDVIISIDGRSASKFTLEQVRELFLQEGKEYKLELRRGKKKFKVKLKTKRLV